MIDLPPKVRPGERLKASTINALIDAVRRSRPLQSSSIRVTQSVNGSVLEAVVRNAPSRKKEGKHPFKLRVYKNGDSYIGCVYIPLGSCNVNGKYAELANSGLVITEVDTTDMTDDEIAALQADLKDWYEITKSFTIYCHVHNVRVVSTETNAEISTDSEYIVNEKETHYEKLPDSVNTQTKTKTIHTYWDFVVGGFSAVEVNEKTEYIIESQILTSALILNSGSMGENGGYYTPSVDASGNLTWTASKEGMPSVGSVNIKGVKGDTGNVGPTGASGSLTDADRAFLNGATGAATDAAQRSAQSASGAAQSAQSAEQAKIGALNAEGAAGGAASAAEQSAQKAAQSEANALKSAQDAAKSAGEVAANVLDVQKAAEQAAESEKNALASAQDAAQSEAEAKQSEANAAQFETNAAQSENNAAQSEANAAQSEANAAQSEANAAQSERSADTYAGNALKSAELAVTAAGSAGDNATAAEDSAKRAAQILEQVKAAQQAAQQAKEAAESAKTSAVQAKEAAERAQSDSETNKSDAQTAKEGAESAKSDAETAKKETEALKKEFEDSNPVFHDNVSKYLAAKAGDETGELEPTDELASTLMVKLMTGAWEDAMSTSSGSASMVSDTKYCAYAFRCWDIAKNGFAWYRAEEIISKYIDGSVLTNDNRNEMYGLNKNNLSWYYTKAFSIVDIIKLNSRLKNVRFSVRIRDFRGIANLTYAQNKEIASFAGMTRVQLDNELYFPWAYEGAFQGYIKAKDLLDFYDDPDCRPLLGLANESTEFVVARYNAETDTIVDTNLKMTVKSIREMYQNRGVSFYDSGTKGIK